MPTGLVWCRHLASSPSLQSSSSCSCTIRAAPTAAQTDGTMSTAAAASPQNSMTVVTALGVTPVGTSSLVRWIDTRRM